MRSFFKDLPNVSGILLAAVGFALMFMPEAMKLLEGRKTIRWILAGACVVLGIVGFISAHIQRKDNDREQQELKRQIAAVLSASLLQATADDMHGLRNDIVSGFERVERAIGSLGAQFPPRAEIHAEPPAAVVQHIQMSERRVPSTRADAPYGLQVILQTDVQQQPTAFIIECDGEITAGEFFMAGQAVMMGVAYGVQPDKKRFYLRVSFPPFTPQSPIVVTLLSKSAVRVTRVERASQ